MLQQCCHINSPDVTEYHSLLLSKAVIASRSKSVATKRDNSGVLYSEDTNLCCCVLEKIFTIDDIAYCIISKLTPLTDQLCHDTTTNAQLHKHYIACQPLRFA